LANLAHFWPDLVIYTYLDHFWSLKTICGHFRPFLVILDHFRLFEMVLKMKDFSVTEHLREINLEDFQNLILIKYAYSSKLA